MRLTHKLYLRSEVACLHLQFFFTTALGYFEETEWKMEYDLKKKKSLPIRTCVWYLWVVGVEVYSAEEFDRNQMRC